jgi:hypothetical protein
MTNGGIGDFGEIQLILLKWEWNVMERSKRMLCIPAPQISKCSFSPHRRALLFRRVPEVSARNRRDQELVIADLN